MHRALFLIAAILPLGCSTVGEAPPAPLQDTTQFAAHVAAWAEYEHEGVSYLHLWSPDAPKSVFLVRADKVDPAFRATLERELPRDKRLTVLLVVPAFIQEAPTYVRSASIVEQERVENGVMHRIPATQP